MATMTPGRNMVTEVDVPGRLVFQRDDAGNQFWFANAPVFNNVRMTRRGVDFGRIATTLDGAASFLGIPTTFLMDAITAWWEQALTSQPGPGPGVPIDPGIPPEDPDDDMRIIPEEPLFPGPIPGDEFMPIQTSSMSPALLAAVFALLSAVGRSAARGLIIRWASIPTWGQRLLIAAGFTIGADIAFDTGPGDSGFIDLPFPLWGGLPDIPGLPIGGGGRLGEPGAIVEALTVGTWNANGVTFHRLSDGRFAVQNKHGVWKIWRPKKPVVLFTTGNADLRDILKADRILQKEAKKIAKLLRNRGFKVARHLSGHSN